MSLDRAEELYGKHTVFGRVVGNTIFSKSCSHTTYNHQPKCFSLDVLKIGEVGRLQPISSTYRVASKPDPKTFSHRIGEKRKTNLPSQDPFSSHSRQPLRRHYSPHNSCGEASSKEGKRASPKRAGRGCATEGRQEVR